MYSLYHPSKPSSQLACPAYPYHPRAGVFLNGSPWEYFCPSWFLLSPGSGTITFKASGNDIYLGLFDSVGTMNFKYAFIICGWNNTQIHLYKDSDWTSIHGEDYDIPNPESVTEWAVSFNKEDSSISVRHEGNLVFYFKDPHYNAPNAVYVSFSQYGHNVDIYDVEVKPAILEAKLGFPKKPDVQNVDYPYKPKKGVSDGGRWEHFCLDWRLPTDGTGLIYFTAKGNDIYLGLFNEKDTKKFQYGIIIAGWNNTEAKVFKSDWNNALISAPVTIADTKSWNNFCVIFNAKKKSVAIIVNQHLVLAFYDPNYNAKEARWVSFSQQGDNVLIKNIDVDYCKFGIISGILGENEE